MRKTKSERWKIILSKMMTPEEQELKKRKRYEKQKRYLSSIDQVPVAVQRGNVRRGMLTR